MRVSLSSTLPWLPPAPLIPELHSGLFKFDPYQGQDSLKFASVTPTLYQGFLDILFGQNMKQLLKAILHQQN
jgi:hypothetical protein